MLTITLLFYYFIHFNWKKDGLNHKGNLLWQVLIMAGHAMLKTCPSGLSDNKNLGLRPRLLSIWIPLDHVFNIAWPAIIKTYNKIELWPHNYLHQRDSIMRVINQSSCFTVLFGLSLRYQVNMSYSLSLILLTHWSRVTHIYVGNLKTIVSDNSLSPDRRQAVI